MKDVFSGALLHMESDCNWRDNNPNLSDALIVTAAVLSAFMSKAYNQGQRVNPVLYMDLM